MAVYSVCMFSYRFCSPQVMQVPRDLNFKELQTQILKHMADDLAEGLLAQSQVRRIYLCCSPLMIQPQGCCFERKKIYIKLVKLVFFVFVVFVKATHALCCIFRNIFKFACKIMKNAPVGGGWEGIKLMLPQLFWLGTTPFICIVWLTTGILSTALISFICRFRGWMCCSVWEL